MSVFQLISGSRGYALREHNAFCIAAAAGDVNTLRKIYSVYGDETIRSHNFQAFRLAVKHGQLAAVNWFVNLRQNTAMLESCALIEYRDIFLAIFVAAPDMQRKMRRALPGLPRYISPIAKNLLCVCELRQDDIAAAKNLRGFALAAKHIDFGLPAEILDTVLGFISRKARAVIAAMHATTPTMRGRWYAQPNRVLCRDSFLRALAEN